METFREKYDSLCEDYKRAEHSLVAIQTKKKDAEVRLKEIDASIKKILKNRVGSIDDALDELSKAINLKLSSLSERITGYEVLINQFMSDSSSDIENTLEEV